MLGKAAGIELMHVPYKGAAAAVTDLASGQVQVSVQSLPSSIAFIKDGRIRPLAVVNEKRVAALPDVPTVGETVKGLGYTPWYGLFAPAGTPRTVVERLHAEIDKAVDSPDARARLANVGCEPAKSSSADFSAMIRRELPRWARVVKDSGATVD
jgi:tripartite-type tricarboxylate transporter receptor subunit TctC